MAKTPFAAVIGRSAATDLVVPSGKVLIVTWSYHTDSNINALGALSGAVFAAGTYPSSTFLFRMAMYGAPNYTITTPTQCHIRGWLVDA